MSGRDQRVYNQSDAVVSGSATRPEEVKGVKDRKKGSRKAMWAWNLYLKIVVLLVKGVRRITWPISHLL